MQLFKVIIIRENSFTWVYIESNCMYKVETWSKSILYIRFQNFESLENNLWTHQNLVPHLHHFCMHALKI